MSNLTKFIAIAAPLLVWTILFFFYFVPNSASLASVTITEILDWFIGWAAPVQLAGVLWLVVSNRQIIGDSVPYHPQLDLSEIEDAQLYDPAADNGDPVFQWSDQAGRMTIPSAMEMAMAGEAALKQFKLVQSELTPIVETASSLTGQFNKSGSDVADQINQAISGFERLNEISNQSRRRLSELAKSLTEVDTRIAQIDSDLEQRFQRLQKLSETHNAMMAQSEASALKAMDDMLHELEASFRAMDDRVRKADARTLAHLESYLDTFEEDLTGRLTLIDQLDRKSMEVARQRVEDLQAEARRFHDSLMEMDEAFAIKVEQKRKSTEAQLKEIACGQVTELDNPVPFTRQSKDFDIQSLQTYCLESERLFEELEQRFEAIAARNENMRAAFRHNFSQTEVELSALQDSASNAEQHLLSLFKGADRYFDPIRAANEATEAGRAIAARMHDQLIMLKNFSRDFETLLTGPSQNFMKEINNEFARRMAEITDNLNLVSADIAEALSREVDDKSWAAYLKGDRGVFVRRTVRLFDHGTQRKVRSLYRADEKFRATVNVYISDFEVLLRKVLSTRDGTTLGVIILGSDIGRVYVALAQAVERLRT